MGPMGAILKTTTRDSVAMADGFIPKHGGYQGLLSYRKAEIVYDATVKFCERLLEKRDRTVDQMVQAARSGKQNIAEASMASATSKETEIKLMNVARASLEELLVDYQDYLRTRDLRLWEKGSEEARFVRKLGADRDVSYETFREFFDTRSPEVVANIIVCLIHQTNFLLGRMSSTCRVVRVRQGHRCRILSRSDSAVGFARTSCRRRRTYNAGDTTGTVKHE